MKSLEIKQLPQLPPTFLPVPHITQIVEPIQTDKSRPTRSSSSPPLFRKPNTRTRSSSCPPLPAPTRQELPSITPPPHHPGPSGGRLAKFYEGWLRCTKNKWVLSVVRHGLRVPFRCRPHQRIPPPETTPSSDRTLTGEAVQEFLDENVLEPAPRKTPRWSPLYRHSHFTVPKKGTTKVRHIINMKAGNRFVVKTHFKMEGLESLRSIIRQNDWCVKVDIASAFTHVMIHHSHRDFFRIRWKGREYRFRAMPFGYRDSPRIFTMLMRAALKPLRERGIRLVAYLDDILLLASSPTEAAQHGKLLVDHLASLGFNLKLEKCVLRPSQKIEFLGMSLDTNRLILTLPPSKVAALRKDVRSLRDSHQRTPPSAKEVASLVGRLVATHAAVEPALLYTRALNTDTMRARRRGGWREPVTLSAESLSDLERWLGLLSNWDGRLLFAPKPEVVVTTDASGLAWGAWLSTPQNPENPVMETWGLWSRAEKRRSSNWREAMASLLALQAFRLQIQRKAVLLRTDNTSNVANVNRGGGSSSALTEVARQVWDFCRVWECSVRAEYKPGVQNERADRLSRLTHDNSDWRLDPAIFRRVEALWGPFTIDLFATRLNAQLPRYFSYRPDPGAVALDALAQPWSTEVGYGNPPFGLAGKVLRKVREEGVTAVLILPVWRSSVWWPLLLELLVELPRILPRRTDTYRPDYTSNELGVGLPPWESVAVKVSGDRVAQLDFQTRLCALPLTPDAHQRFERALEYGSVSSAIALRITETPWPRLL